MKRLLFSALSLVLVGAPVVADDEADTADVYEMGEVIITGSKLPQTPGNVTQKISIITADEMGSLVLGNGNLAEMLSYTPGNFANVLSRNDANWGSSGGLAHTYKGYMLDGLPIDAFVDLQSLDPWAFQRVEDQRGSASVLYPTYLAMDFAGNQSPLAGTANFILKERVGKHPHQCLGLLRLVQHPRWSLLSPAGRRQSAPLLRRSPRGLGLHRLRHRRLVATDG